jgi:hypothetical protein
MSPASDLAAQQSRLKAQIAAHGHPPPGDPDALQAYARFLMNEAHKAADLAQHEASLVGRIDFVSHGAVSLFENMREVAKSFGAAQGMLEHAAQVLIQRADQLAADQQRWFARRSTLDSELARLDNLAARQSA